VIERTAVLTANRGFALWKSRLLLIERMMERGWRIIVATSDDEYAKLVVERGAILEPVEISRRGLSPWQDLTVYRALLRIYGRHKPSLIHHFHAKPVLLGTLAARRALGDGTIVVNTITGLGHVFLSGTVTRFLASIGYATVLKHGDMTIFQNDDDRRLFLEKGWVRGDNSCRIPGSGVDTTLYSVADPGSREQNTVLMAGRLLRSKGVGEYLAAAEKVRSTHPEVRFLLAGEAEPCHPDSFPEESIRKAEMAGNIQYLGYCETLPELLPTVGVVVLPSYYREGIPRVLLEAAACGVPAVGADVPGTREAIIDGKTGFLVPPRDSQALAEAIEKIIGDPDLAAKLGEAARRMACQRFDLSMVTRRQLDIYRSLGVDC